MKTLPGLIAIYLMVGMIFMMLANPTSRGGVQSSVEIVLTWPMIFFMHTN